MLSKKVFFRSPWIEKLEKADIAHAGQVGGGRGATKVMHDGSHIAIQPPITRRSTSGFHQLATQSLLLAESDVRCSASGISCERYPSKSWSWDEYRLLVPTILPVDDNDKRILVWPFKRRRWRLRCKRPFDALPYLHYAMRSFHVRRFKVLPPAPFDLTR